MAKFKFRLTTLLRLRETTRDERRAELAQAYGVDDVLRDRLERVGREVERIRRECREAAGPGEVDVDRLAEAQRYELALRAQQTQLVRQRETVAAEIQRRRQALLDANRDVRVLEKLRDKQADAHRAAEDRREARRLDEAAQVQFMREGVG
jgi:flagellar FliJ protein